MDTFGIYTHAPACAHIHTYIHMYIVYLWDVVRHR